MRAHRARSAVAVSAQDGDDDAVVRFYAVFSSYVLAAAASVAGLVIAARRKFVSRKRPG